MNQNYTFGQIAAVSLARMSLKKKARGQTSKPHDFQINMVWVALGLRRDEYEWSGSSGRRGSLAPEISRGRLRTRVHVGTVGQEEPEMSNVRA